MLILHKDAAASFYKSGLVFLGETSSIQDKRPVSYREAGLLWAGGSEGTPKKDKTKSDWRTQSVSVFKTDTSLIPALK
jgi:hypothetical protein